MGRGWSVSSWSKGPVSNVGKRTLKTFVVKIGKAFFRVEHPKYPDLIPCEDLTIQGVLRALIRKVRERIVRQT